MALIKCPECNNDISNKTNCCIYCGYKFKKRYFKNIVIVFIIFILLIVIGICIGKIIHGINEVDDEWNNVHNIHESNIKKSEEIHKNIIDDD